MKNNCSYLLNKALDTFRFSSKQLKINFLIHFSIPYTYVRSSYFKAFQALLETLSLFSSKEQYSDLIIISISNLPKFLLHYTLFRYTIYMSKVFICFKLSLLLSFQFAKSMKKLLKDL